MRRLAVRTFASAAALIAMLSACGGGTPAANPDPSPTGPSLIVEGDKLCAELFRRNAEYLAGEDLDVDEYVSVGDRLMPSFKKLVPPQDDDRWTEALAARWNAVTKAVGARGDLSGAVYQLIGAARATGLWLCGPDADAVLEKAVAAYTPTSTISVEEYAKRLDAVIGDSAPEHEEYHHHPDPKEIEQRLIPGNVDSHGPGYLKIQGAMIDAMAALPAPEGSEREAAIFLHLMREALAAETEGIRAGGTRGEALFEPSYALTWQAIGVACVAWGLDLCD